MKPMPKEKELLQLSGRGTLDFGPILKALAAIDYRGWTEVFMHPTPRGIPILPTTAEVTAEINRAREHLDRLAGGALTLTRGRQPEKGTESAFPETQSPP